MSLALMLVLQAAAAPTPPAQPGPADSAPLAIDFDLARLRPAGAGFGPAGRGCRSDDPAPILVCARRSGGAFPMDEMERLFAVRPLVAEMGIGGGGTARTYVEQVALDRGAVANRIMVGIRLPF